MSTTNRIKQHSIAQLAGHAVMLAFAVASLSNVESFFAALHPGLPALSWGLGIALGLGLVVMAGLLSGMPWQWGNSKFQVVLTVTAALALLSGGIQGAAYDAHMTNSVAAYVLGLALPLVGELGVALAVSAHTQAQRAQRMSEAQTQLADGIQRMISEAITNIDPTRVERQVGRAADVLTRAIADSTIAKMMGDLGVETGNLQEISKMPQEISDFPNLSSFSVEQPRTGIEAMNAERRRKKEERRSHVTMLISNLGALSAVELCQRLRDDFGIEASEKTVSTDCAELGFIRDGKTWKSAAVEFASNGHSHP